MVSAASPSSGGLPGPRRRISTILPSLTADVGVESVRARAVDDGSAGDLEVEHDYSLELPCQPLRWSM